MNEILQYIDIRNDFKLGNHCPYFRKIIKLNEVSNFRNPIKNKSRNSPEKNFSLMLEMVVT